MRPSEPRRRFSDEPVALALVALMVLYFIVTLLTYHKISYGDGLLQEAIQAARYELQHDATSLSQKETTTSQQEDPIQVLQRTFPLHVGTDREEIVHPGLALAQDLSKVPADLPRTVKVAKFFEDSHGSVYGGSIRKYLGDGQRLMKEQEALTIGSKVDGDLETIYCSVASYRDPECSPTVEDLYLRAEHPERIRVAIIDQRAEGDDVCGTPQRPCEEDPDQALCKYKHLIDYYEVDARLAVGPVFARHLANRFYRGEYFSMQIDSHVRFIEHWDSDIVSQWKETKNEYAVLTTYLSDINGAIHPITHKSLHHTRPIMCASDYEGQGEYKHLRHGQQPEGVPFFKDQPTLHPFWAAGFSFARGHFVIQVPYDQYLPMVFQGEEISIGLRGFTYGYDYYTPERGVCFHMYAIKDNEEKRKKIPLFWENSNTYKGVGMKAMRRLNNIIGMATSQSDDWQRDEMEKYGLGRVRDPAKFFKTFGIHTDTQTVEHHLCRFVGQPMMKEFLPALRPNRMGIDYDKISYVFVDPAPEETKGNLGW